MLDDPAFDVPVETDQGSPVTVVVTVAVTVVAATGTIVWICVSRGVGVGEDSVT